MTHHLVIAHCGLRRGENYGLYVQHVETLRWLFADDPSWRVIDVDVLHPSFPDLALNAGILLVTMMAAPEIEAAIRLRRERGLRTLFEISDNVLAPGGWLAREHRLRSPLVRQNILFHASQCDALQVYAPALAELFRSVNLKIAVLDPYVPIAPFPEKPSGFVVGWGGTSSHRDDLLPVAPVVRRFCARHRDARFAFMGSRDLFDELFDEIAPEQKRHRPFGTFNEYLDFCRGLHAALAPLRPTPFNAARTDTKFATFAATGAAALLEEARCYRPHAGRARLFASPEELERHLEELYGDRDGLRALTSRAYDWALEQRGHDALRAQRERLYRPMLPGRETEIEEPPPAEDLVARLTDALAQPKDKRVPLLRELLREHPQYPQVRWLLRSGELHPLYADLEARRDRRRSRDAVDKLSFYRDVLRRQPYDFFALSAVIRLLSRTAPGSAELDELYARAALVAPDSIPPSRRPAHLEAFLPS